MTTSDLRDLQRASRRIMARAFMAWCRVHFAHIHNYRVAA